MHARNSPADEVDETTEDTEMGVSEDDDDPPPPIIPRRPGKLRPQTKVRVAGLGREVQQSLGNEVGGGVECGGLGGRIVQAAVV